MWYSKNASHSYLCRELFRDDGQEVEKKPQVPSFFVLLENVDQILDWVAPLGRDAVDKERGHGHAQPGLHDPGTSVWQEQVQDPFS